MIKGVIYNRKNKTSRFLSFYYSTVHFKSFLNKPCINMVNSSNIKYDNSHSSYISILNTKTIYEELVLSN